MSLLNTLQFISTHPLNRDNKAKALIRFLRWQIASRLAHGAVAYDWINGSKFWARPGESGITGNIYTGLHEFADMAYLLHILRDDEIFIDIGANVGSYSILACAAIGARGYAFEPIPSTYKRLLENIELNNLGNRVRCFNIALGREDGNIAFSRNMDSENHVLAAGEQCADSLTVQVSPLDAILKAESPAIMKIDVEGFETPVLEGAVETLKKQSLHSIILELNGSGSRYGFDEARIIEAMYDHGFKIYSYDPLRRILASKKHKDCNTGNTLFIRDETIVLDRLRHSPTISVHGKQF